jgi:hypothetical protein
MTVYSHVGMIAEIRTAVKMRISVVGLQTGASVSEKRILYVCSAKEQFFSLKSAFLTNE